MQHNLARGILLLLGTMVIIGTMDALSKLLVHDLAVGQILAVRYWMFFCVAAWMAHRSIGLGAAYASKRPWVQLIRSGILMAEMALFIQAFVYMHLGDVHAIAAAAPLLVMVMAAVFLGEQIGPHRKAAVAIGFLGVLVIIRPGSGVFGWPALLPVAATLGWATYQVLLRQVSAYDRSETTVLYTATVGLVVYSVAGLVLWQPPTAEQWLLLAGVGVMGSAGHILLVKAYEQAPASALQPYNYGLPLWAVFVGWLVFDHLPDAMTFAGGGLVIVGGLYALWRERLRRGEGLA
ncbi:MAG: DMT family transporter [Alphaproteobacteria bacterium]|nr:DMT family transporter [Alphaproteobacteria bacterium]MCB9929391.1 DMT family transporter [Alphaproteobacteria bacterium]